jgi:hypothetical protein
MAQDDRPRDGFLAWLREHYLGFQTTVAVFWGLTSVFYGYEVAAHPGDKGHIFMLVLAVLVCALTTAGAVGEHRRRRNAGRGASRTADDNGHEGDAR